MPRLHLHSEKSPASLHPARCHGIKKQVIRSTRRGRKTPQSPSTKFTGSPGSPAAFREPWPTSPPKCPNRYMLYPGVPSPAPRCSYRKLNPAHRLVRPYTPQQALSQPQHAQAKVIAAYFIVDVCKTYIRERICLAAKIASSSIITVHKAVVHLDT